jgi:hypothetical protein
MTNPNQNPPVTKIVEMPGDMQAVIAAQTTLETFQRPAIIDGAPEHLGVAPAEVTESSREPVVIENFQGDPRRVIGHPSNPATMIFEGIKAPGTPKSPAIPYLGQKVIEHLSDSTDE